MAFCSTRLQITQCSSDFAKTSSIRNQKQIEKHGKKKRFQIKKVLKSCSKRCKNLLTTKNNKLKRYLHQFIANRGDQTLKKSKNNHKPGIDPCQLQQDQIQSRTNQLQSQHDLLQLPQDKKHNQYTSHRLLILCKSIKFHPRSCLNLHQKSCSKFMSCRYSEQQHPI